MMPIRFYLLGCIVGCLILSVGLMGCGDIRLPDFSKNAPSAPPDGVNHPGAAPSPEGPPLAVAPNVPPRPPAVASLTEQAAGLLPAARPGMPHDTPRGQRVWRVVESYQTAAGVTARFAVVDLAEDAAIPLQVNDLLDTGGTGHQLSLAIIGRSIQTSQPVPLGLVHRRPLTFRLFWSNSRSKVIGQVQQFAFSLPDEEMPLIFRSPPAGSPPTAPMSTDDLADALAVFRAGCTPESPGTVFWQRNMLTGIAAVTFSSWSDAGLPEAGEFFVPGEPRSHKEFRVELTQLGDGGDITGTLETIKGTGIVGKPTREPSTTNLLLKDSTARYSVRFYGHELYGQDMATPINKLSISVVPPSLGLILN